MSNKLKEKIIEQEPEIQDEPVVQKTPKQKSKIAKNVVGFLNGSFLTSENTLSHVPFLLYLVGIALIYIANSYYAETTVREINSITSELKELKSEYITTKSDLMHVSKQSQVALLAAQVELKESTIPPKKLIVKTKKEVKE